ncbi:YfhO family protein [Patescibacteria group bacterium]|nr:YfhO family protein [Patescibacteria group bacterium]
MLKRIRQSWLMVLVALGAILIRFWPMFLGQSIIFGDNFSLMVPGKLFTASWLKQGILPLWNPTILGGISWIGDINQSLFHPSTLLFVFFQPDVALNLLIISLLFLSFLGVIKLTRSLQFSVGAGTVAGLLWVLSPVMMGYTRNISLLQTAVLLPWVVWAGLRLGKGRMSFLIFILILVCQVVSGYPPMVALSLVMTWVIFLSYHWPNYKLTWSKVWQTLSFRACLVVDRVTLGLTKLAGRNSWGNKILSPRLNQDVSLWLWAIGLTLGLTAFIWLPFLQTLAGSTRSVQTVAQAVAGGVHPAELFKLILPNLFDNAAVGYKWGPIWNRSVSILPYLTWFGGLILLGFLAQFRQWQRQDKTYLGLAIISLLLALSSPFFNWLMSNLPLLSWARGPGTWLMIASLSLALLVGRALDQVQINQKLRRTIVWVGMGSLILVILTYGLVKINFDQIWSSLDVWLGFRLSTSQFHTLARDQVIIEALLLDLLVALAGLVGAGLAWSKKQWLIVIFFVCLDLSWQTRGIILFGSGAVYRMDASEMTAQSLLANINTRQYRILTQNYNHPYTGFDAYFEAISLRQPFSDSYVTEIEMRTYEHAQRLKAGLTPDWNMPVNIPMIHGFTTLLPLDIARQFTPQTQDLGINQLPEIKLDDPYLRNWSVGYYLEDTWFGLTGQTDDLPIIKEESIWQLKKLPMTYARFRFETYQPAQLDQFRETPNQLWLSLENRKKYQTLIVADRYDRNWQAIVNGQPVVVARLDQIRQLPIEQGTNNIELSYFPRLFYFGLILAGMTLFLTVFYLDKSVGRQLN